MLLHLDQINFHIKNDHLTIENIELRAPDSLIYIAECMVKGDRISLKAHNIYLKDIDFPDNTDVEITVLGSSATNIKRGQILDNVRGHINFKNEPLEDIPAVLNEELIVIQDTYN